MSDTTQALELTHDHIHTLLGIGNPTEEESRLLRLGWIAGIEAVQAAAKCLHQIAEPAAWMDPVTMDVINDARKQAWTRDYGAGGAAKAAAYTVGLGPLAPAADAREVPAATEWRELCRRLYVELFSCDQQMMEATDEEGEPMWQQGSTVRDVLRDAKAMLAAAPAPAQEAAPALEAPAAFVRKPLAPEEIQAGHKAAGLEKMLDTFTMGVEFAECEHGVSAEAPQAPAAPVTDDDPMNLRGVGEALLEAIETNYAALQAAGWHHAMNCPSEIVADLLNLLDEAKAAPAAPAVDAREVGDDKALLDFLRDSCCDLRSIDVPTGGDDSDVHWRVIEHHMSEPREREIGRSWSDDPREAIRAAIAAQAKGGNHD